THCRGDVPEGPAQGHRQDADGGRETAQGRAGRRLEARDAERHVHLDVAQRPQGNGRRAGADRPVSRSPTRPPRAAWGCNTASQARAPRRGIAQSNFVRSRASTSRKLTAYPIEPPANTYVCVLNFVTEVDIRIFQ